MCTVTWHREREGYHLLFSRDERRTRLEAIGPRIHEGPAYDGRRVRFIMAEDGDAGGTWVAVNAHGLTVGVLNGYLREDDEAWRPRSRGRLVKDLASLRSVREVGLHLDSFDPQRYRSFRLLAMDPDSSLVADWDGNTVRRGPAEGRIPLVSSSFEETAVGEARRAAYAAEVGADPAPERLHAYHRSHAGGPSAYSVCMHRQDAETRSLTRIRVRARDAELVYHPGPPCTPAPETAVRLDRAAPAGQDQGVPR